MKRGGPGRRIVWFAALVLAVLCTLGAAFLSAPVVGATPTAGPAGGQFQPVADCLRKNGRLAALLVVDQSGSLRQTDPNNSRVVGVQAALAGLGELARGDRAVEVQAKIAGFDVGYGDITGWTAVDPSSVDGMRSQAQLLTNRNIGYDTDYVEAFGKAQEDLAAQSVRMNRTGAKDVCKLVILFTDGEFSIEDRVSQALQDKYGSTKPWATDVPLTSRGSGAALVAGRGMSTLCGAGGIVTQLRHDGVFTGIVALRTQAMAPGASELLQAIATGSGPGQTCGVADAAAQRSGAYLGVDNVDGLAGALLNAGLSSPPVIDRGNLTTCPAVEDQCPKGTQTFDIDGSLNRFNLLAIAGSSQVKVLLRGPDHAALDLQRGGGGQSVLSSATVRWTWLSPTAVFISGDLPPSSRQWIGKWSVTFIDTSNGTANVIPNRIAIYIFGDTQAALLPGAVFRKGEATTFKVRLVTAKGQPRSPDSFRTGSTLTASMTPTGGTAQPVTLTPDGGGVFTGSYRPAASLAAGTAVLHMDLTTRTSFGVSLPAVGTDTTVKLLNPAGFPQIDLGGMDRLQLSSIDGRGVGTGTFRVTAGPTGAGCVWLENSQVLGSPRSAGRITYGVDDGRTRASCVRVAAGQVRTVRVKGEPSGSAAGRVDGQLTLRILSAATGRERVEVVPVRFEMSRPLNLAKGAKVFVGLLLAGLLIPIILLYLLNFRTARFEVVDRLRYAIFDVAVDEAGVTRRDGLTPLIATPEGEIKYLERLDDRKHFELGLFEFSAVVPRLPTSAVSGRVAARDMVVVSDRGGTGGGEYAVVSLGLGGTWVFAAVAAEVAAAWDEAALARPVVGSLICMFGQEVSFDEQRQLLEERIMRTLPTSLGGLASRLPKDPADTAGPDADAGSGYGMPADPTPTSGPTISAHYPDDSSGVAVGTVVSGSGGWSAAEPAGGSSTEPDLAPPTRPPGEFRIPD